MRKPSFAVVGAGNGGHAFAAHIALQGSPVSVFDIEKEKIAFLRQKGTIDVSGAVTGSPDGICFTDDIGDAVKDKDIIMVVVPSCYHGGIARLLAPVVADNQIIMLNTCATGSTLEFRLVFSKMGVKANVTLGETDTLLYACRSDKPGSVNIFGIKERINFATLPAKEAENVAKLINQLFPQFIPAENVLYISLNNANSVCHPAPTLLNTARIENATPYEFYVEGVTPGVGRLMERSDAERLALGAALGMKLLSLKQLYELHYNIYKDTLWESMVSTPAYKGLMGPTTMNCRQMFEDVPMGLVPLVSLGDALGVPMPVSKMIVELANIVTGRDFWKEGRKVEEMGLSGMSAEEILAFVN